MNNNTKQLLIRHYQTYPKLQAEDLFKYVYQSAYGCEHLVSDQNSALKYIETEYADIPHTTAPLIEKLDGEYSRVHLSCLNAGLTAETLAKLFCASSKTEPSGDERLRAILGVATELVNGGTIPLDKNEFALKLENWKNNGYNAVRHSAIFREAYSPAYRVISNRYADFLQVFSEIDAKTKNGSAVIAIEGGSASGKTTFASNLKDIYGCAVIHMDDFFLRPEQRTPERFAEIGGNVDRERFIEEVLSSLTKKETITYRPFLCSKQVLGDPITVVPGRLTVIEGAYSTHPELGRYYDLGVFLDIAPEYQKERILKRNTPAFAKRFFEEWIPLENRYFSGFDTKNRVDLTVKIDR